MLTTCTAANVVLHVHYMYNIFLGPYKVAVRYAGIPIPNSPFVVVIEPKYDSAAVKVSGEGITGPIRASLPTNFLVNTSDAGDAELNIHILVCLCSLFNCCNIEGTLYIFYIVGFFIHHCLSSMFQCSIRRSFSFRIQMDNKFKQIFPYRQRIHPRTKLNTLLMILGCISFMSLMEKRLYLTLHFKFDRFHLVSRLTCTTDM